MPTESAECPLANPFQRIEKAQVAKEGSESHRLLVRPNFPMGVVQSLEEQAAAEEEGNNNRRVVCLKLPRSVLQSLQDQAAAEKAETKRIPSSCGPATSDLTEQSDETHQNRHLFQQLSQSIAPLPHGTNPHGLSGSARNGPKSGYSEAAANPHHSLPTPSPLYSPTCVDACSDDGSQVPQSKLSRTSPVSISSVGSRIKSQRRVPHDYATVSLEATAISENTGYSLLTPRQILNRPTSGTACSTSTEDSQDDVPLMRRQQNRNRKRKRNHATFTSSLRQRRTMVLDDEEVDWEPGVS